MLKKQSEKGKCPFRNLKPCDDSCVLYRKGIRYNEKTNETFPFEECALNIIADNLEAMHNRTFMMQREVGDTKNIIALKTMVDLNMANPQQMQDLQKHIKRYLVNDEVKKIDQ